MRCIHTYLNEIHHAGIAHKQNKHGHELGIGKQLPEIINNSNSNKKTLLQCFYKLTTHHWPKELRIWHCKVWFNCDYIVTTSIKFC